MVSWMGSWASSGGASVGAFALAATFRVFFPAMMLSLSSATSETVVGALASLAVVAVAAVAGVVDWERTGRSGTGFEIAKTWVEVVAACELAFELDLLLLERLILHLAEIHFTSLGAMFTSASDQKEGAHRGNKHWAIGKGRNAPHL